jgi:hypothetical protein
VPNSFQFQHNHQVTSINLPNPAVPKIRNPPEPSKQYIFPHPFFFQPPSQSTKPSKPKTHNNHQRHKHATHQASRHNIYVLSAIIFHLTPLTAENTKQWQKLRICCLRRLGLAMWLRGGHGLRRERGGVMVWWGRGRE